MGMIVNFLRVSDRELDSYFQDSSLLEKRVFNSDIEKEDPNCLDIGKMWEGIIFLLTGHGIDTAFETSGEFFRTIFSGQLIDEEQDLGYGPAHYLHANEARTLCFQLQELDLHEVMLRFDAQKMMQLGIYPECWEEEDILEELMETLQEIQNFYEVAVEQNQAIISFMC